MKMIIFLLGALRLSQFDSHLLCFLPQVYSVAYSVAYVYEFSLNSINYLEYAITTLKSIYVYECLK